jgi:catechol 2,3-dioxygenase-like lactoylglutathione lyase family enzyme
MTTTTASSTGALDLNALRPRVAYVAYHVNDIDRALAFYVGVLGMKEQMRMPLGNGEQEVVLAFPESKGAGVILMWNTERKTPYQPGDGYNRFVLTVSDLDAAMALLARHDTRITKSPTDAGSMRYAIAVDPDGYSIELLQFKRG